MFAKPDYCKTPSGVNSVKEAPLLPVVRPFFRLLFLFPVLTVSILSALWVKNRSPGIASAGPYLYERIFGLLLDRIFADMGHNKPLELEMGPKPRTVLQL